MNKQKLPIVGSYSSTKLQRKKKVINDVIVNCFTKNQQSRLQQENTAPNNG